MNREAYERELTECTMRAAEQMLASAVLEGRIHSYRVDRGRGLVAIRTKPMAEELSICFELGGTVEEERSCPADF